MCPSYNENEALCGRSDSDLLTGACDAARGLLHTLWGSASLAEVWREEGGAKPLRF